ncbi:MAG: insulinase family protein, partial [Bacteroidota bacterium]
VKDFYSKYYCPNNAILTVAGDVTLDQIKHLSEKWFGIIAKGDLPKRNIEQEPLQKEARDRDLEGNIPLDAVYLAFQMPDRLHDDYYTVDLLSDILCNGRSSRLYQKLLKEKQFFAQIDCYISGTIDAGVLIVEGRPSEGVSLEQAEVAIWTELDKLMEEGIGERELQKVKNRVESTLVFSEASILNKAINLSYFEVIGDIERINREVELYQQITTEDMMRVAKSILRRDNCSTLRYRVKDTVA